MATPAYSIEADSTEADIDAVYSAHVNRQWVKLLNTLGLNKRFTRCIGTELFTAEGDRYLDFLSGYGVYNAGHHHPGIKAQLVEELGGFRPTMLQSYVPELAAELAERLTSLAGGKLSKVFFTSTGSEGVETAIKFSRAHTKRAGILYSNGGFHGLTCGALSLMSNNWWRDGFGPLLEDTRGIDFGDLDALERELKTERYAAFITEPIQGESGILVPSVQFMQGAERLCKRYGTLFVLDEVQTGLFRTGPFLAAQHFKVNPDMVILAKAMSGGFVPVGAVLLTSAISESVYSSVDRAFIHASTFGENALAMRACLATLDVIESEKLGERGEALGAELRSRINQFQPEFEMLSEARGVGCFSGIEFKAPKTLGLKLLHSGFNSCHPGLFGQMVVKHLFDESRILTQMCGNNYLAIKACPPLNSKREQIDEFVGAIHKLLKTIHTERTKFWSQGLVIAKRVLVA